MAAVRAMYALGTVADGLVAAAQATADVDREVVAAIETCGRAVGEACTVLRDVYADLCAGAEGAEEEEGEEDEDHGDGGPAAGRGQGRRPPPAPAPVRPQAAGGSARRQRGRSRSPRRGPGASTGRVYFQAPTAKTAAYPAARAGGAGNRQRPGREEARQARAPVAAADPLSPRSDRGGGGRRRRRGGALPVGRRLVQALRYGGLARAGRWVAATAAAAWLHAGLAEVRSEVQASDGRLELRRGAGGRLEVRAADRP